jgi:hypothetical protein
MPSQLHNCIGVRGLALSLLLLALLVPGVARSDTLLVSASNNTILEFSLTGQDLGTFASAGLNQPLGLALDRSGNLYVANVADGTIRKFSPTGQDLGIFASTGLRFPAGLAFDRSGNLFVANGQQRPGQTDYSIRKFSPTGQDLGDFAVLSTQPRYLVIAVSAVPAFAGTPGRSNCHGKSVSALARQFGGLAAAAAALEYPSVQALQDAIREFCEE